MRSRELETALRSFLGATGAHLRAEVASGAEVPFEVGSRAGRRRGSTTPLYCYRALTSEFIAARGAPGLRLTNGVTLARSDAIAGLPDAVVVADLPGGADGHLLVIHRFEDDDAGAALAKGTAVLKELLRALRLFGDGRIVLGGVAW